MVIKRLQYELQIVFFVFDFIIFGLGIGLLCFDVVWYTAIALFNSFVPGWCLRI